MKITAPRTHEEYFEKTEHAVRHLYAGLDSCWAVYEEAEQHVAGRPMDHPLTPEQKEALEKYLELAGKYFYLKISEAMFAGGIFQIAYMAIRIYSRNESIPESCVDLVPSTSHPAVPFCIGEERHGVPKGLLIYAARNQYSHWDDDEPHEVTNNVFNALTRAFRDNMLYDLGFSLSNPTINVYADGVLLVALGWRTYDEYLAEMRAMLSPATDSSAA